MVNKDLLKGFVSGMLISSLLFASINAAPIKKSLAVFFNNIQVVVDGVKINPTDAKGNKVQPFSYEGTIYMPLRTVAEALGKEVTWDQKNYTAYIGKAKKDVVGINELKPWEEPSYSGERFNKGVGWSENDNQFIMSQRNYTTQNSLSHTTCLYYYPKQKSFFHNTASITYKLNREYYKLTGIFGVDDLTTSDDFEAKLIIRDIDGKELYSSQGLKKGMAPIAVDVDLLDQEQIRISIEPTDSFTSGDLYSQFTDVKLYTVGK